MNIPDAAETTDLPTSDHTMRAREASGPLVGSALGWWARAHCRGADIDNFFPLPDYQNAVDRALEICGQCPVRNPCRRYAISHRERYGIWGGLTEATREVLMRRASAPPGLGKAAERVHSCR
jgi:WhiB family redox-sensing transcriptional regulator